MNFMQARVTNIEAAVGTKVVTFSFNSGFANMWSQWNDSFKEYMRVEEKVGTVKQVPLILWFITS